MTNAQLAALLAFVAAAGGAVGMSGSALLRETPGAKSYYVREMVLRQFPLADGGNIITARTWTDATLGLSDGGIAVADLGEVDCALTAGQTSSLQTILTAAKSCAQNAP